MTIKIKATVEIKPMRVPNYAILLGSIDGDGEAKIAINRLDRDAAKALINQFTSDFWNKVGAVKMPPKAG